MHTSNKDGVTVPKDYNRLCGFISENKNLILADWGMVSQILDALDNLLNEAENISDLHYDSRIVLATVKLQQDALVREYQRNLSFEKLIEMASSGVLDDFFELVKQKSMTVKFVDQLSLTYTPKEKRERAERTKYDVSLDPASTAGYMAAGGNEDEQTMPIQKIRDVVSRQGEVEYFRLIIDPRSFSKTVHNAFNLALAIREKDVSLISRDGKVFVSGYCPGDGEIDHSVLHLTPAQSKAYAEKLGIEEAML